MNKKWSRQSVKNVQAAVWLIGLGVLFLLDLFWPGILILVGISIIVQYMLPAEEEEIPVAPVQAVEQVEAVEEAVEEESILEDNMLDPVPPPLEAVSGFAAGDLPKECPACGGPVAENAQAVVAVGEGSVVCPFCSAKIPLKS